MGKSLSLDIRERVVSLVEGGYSCHEAARRFRISAASAVRIVQRKRRFGSVVAAVQGRPRVISPFSMGSSCRIHAAVFSFIAGVMPPMPMLGRSLL